MKILATALFGLLMGASTAQTGIFNDPANLRGERSNLIDGRELPVDRGARGLQQLFRKLNTRASLMLIVAHPDDEDGGMLTLYSRGLGARVAMLTLNRGEGGQNASTGDFEDALGLLRTEELLSADRFLAVDQMFGTEADFGFSKTKEESFRKWTHDRVLYDAVRAVRLYRPLVIASVFIGGVTDGHGHHEVAGEIAQEVFKAAGDPKVFRELTAQGILPWQPLKVYGRIPIGAVTEQGLFDYATGQYTPARFTNYVTGEVSTAVPSSDVVVHEGNTDPLLVDDPATSPPSYVSFARVGLGLEKSQIGPDMRLPEPGAFDVAYHRYGSTLQSAPKSGQETSFFDGIDVTVAGIADLAPGAPPAWKAALADIATDINSGVQAFDPQHLERTIPSLRHALRGLDAFISLAEGSAIPSNQKANVLHELRVKRVQLNDALLLAHGIDVQTESVWPAPQGRGYVLSTATELSVDLGLTNRGTTRIDFVGARLRLAQGTPAYQITAFARFPASSLAPSESTGVTLTATLPHGLPVTRPYFRRSSIEQPYYDLELPELRNAPLTPWPATAELTFNDDGISLLRSVVIVDPQESAQPLAVVPPVSVAFSVHAQVLPEDRPWLLTTVLNEPFSITRNEISVKAPEGWKASLQTGDAQEPGTARFRVVTSAKASTGDLQASVSAPGGVEFSESYRAVGYGDLPIINYYRPATEHVVPIDLKLPQHGRIGYLPGTGDAVFESLTSLGLQPVRLGVADLTPATLANFDTVVLGVRAYSAHPDLHGAPTQALFEYVRSGGNVVLQYQTAEFTNEDSPAPLTLGRDAEKVVDENAPVQFLDPAASVLSSPNQLSEADFKGWIEERGHGFLRSWDAKFTAPTETHDPGSVSEGIAAQEPQRGGLVTLQLGSGHWSYCAYALYRQLPEAVPGAYRLLANLLALADQRAAP